MGSLESRTPIVLTRLYEKKEEGGFTLVELLIVVLILGALASTVVVASGGFRTKGVETACRAAKDSYETAFEAYRSDNADGMYPTNDNQVVPTYVKRSGGSSATVSGTPESAVIRGIYVGSRDDFEAMNRVFVHAAKMDKDFFDSRILGFSSFEPLFTFFVSLL